MSEWKEYKLGDITDWFSGGTPSKDKKEFWGGDIPWISAKTMTDYKVSSSELNVTKAGLLNGSRLANEKDILLLVRGSGLFNDIPINIVEKPVAFNQDIKAIRAKNPQLQDYIFFWLQGNKKGLNDILEETGIGAGKFDTDLLKKLEISIPSSESEFNFIIDTAKTIFDKIDLLHRQNATLEKMAETLFRQWFVEPIKKITNEGAEVDDFSNANFGKWIKETVGGEWGKENPEGDFNKVVYCIRGTDIADLNIGLPTKTPIRFVKETKFKNIEPLEGDLIIEISGGTESQSTGRVCYVNQDIKNLFKYPLVFSNFCRMIRVKKAEYSFFLYCYIQYLYNQDEFFNLENGSSGIKNLDYKALLFELEYPMPNENLVIDFHNQVAPFFKKVNQNKIQIRTLSTLRDTLLPKLMSGESTVELEHE